MNLFDTLKINVDQLPLDMDNYCQLLDDIQYYLEDIFELGEYLFDDDEYYNLYADYNDFDDFLEDEFNHLIKIKFYLLHRLKLMNDWYTWEKLTDDEKSNILNENKLFDHVLTMKCIIKENKNSQYKEVREKVKSIYPTLYWLRWKILKQSVPALFAWFKKYYKYQSTTPVDK